MTAIDDRPTSTRAAYDPALADGITDGLRAIITLIEARPDLAEHFRHTFGMLHVPVGARTGNQRTAIQSVAAASITSGATAAEWSDAKHAGIEVAFSPRVVAKFYAGKEFLCDERVVCEVAPFLSGTEATS